MDLNLNLTQEEVNFVVGILGELPTKTGAWTLIQKINTQVTPQLPQPAPQTDAPVNADATPAANTDAPQTDATTQGAN